jgi:glycine oxidase
VVVGGGLIGLACAWRLAADGWSVQVVDAGSGALEASWAAAGMLAPHNEVEVAAPGEPHLWRLGCASLARWPAFADAIGVPIDLAGSLIPEFDDEDGTEIAARLGWLEARGIPCTRIPGAELVRLEPALAPCRGALALPGGRVDPRRACAALIGRLGDRVRYGAPAAVIGERQVVLADGRTIAADEVVVAAGAWSPALAHLCGLTLAGEPVKGQMLRFASDPGLARFVHCRHAYLVPRPGAGLIVGSTMVWDGFDRREDPEAIARLAAGARRLIPALAGREPVETWVGLRPRLAGGLPCIDRVRPGVILATGHFRNGILLAPATADLVADLAAGRESAVDRGPFRVPGDKAFAPPGPARTM